MSLYINIRFDLLTERSVQLVHICVVQIEFRITFQLFHSVKKVICYRLTAAMKVYFVDLADFQQSPLDQVHQRSSVAQRLDILSGNTLIVEFNREISSYFHLFSSLIIAILKLKKAVQINTFKYFKLAAPCCVIYFYPMLIGIIFSGRVGGDGLAFGIVCCFCF